MILPVINTHKRPWHHKWVTLRRLTGAFFLTILILSQFHWFPWFKGTTSGTTLLTVVPLTDPLAAIELLITTHSLTTTTIIGASILLFAAILLGPIFCGFVCPLGFVLDLNQSLRRTFRKIVMHKSKRAEVTKAVPHWIRYAILGILLGFALITGIPLFQALSPINLLVRALVMGSFIGLVVVTGLMILEWFFPRVWCRTLCPLGACYSIAGRKAIWRVRINPKTAGQIRCKQCQIRCPMGIEIMSGYTLPGYESISHPSCIRCGDCIDICPNTVLGLRFRPFPSTDKPITDNALHLTMLDSEEESNCNACENIAS